MTRLLAALAIAAAVARPASALSVLVDSAASGSAASPSGPTIGAYMDGSCLAFGSFESWLGKPSGSVYQLVYNPGGTASASFQPTLSQIELAVQANQCGQGNGTLQEISVGFPDSETNIVAGNYDTYYRNLATALALYAPNAIVRLAWEFNGNWFLWGIQSGGSGTYTPAQYVAAWQHVVGVMKAVSGTSSLRFDWCPDLCPGCADPVPAYPGDAYVDVIGLDFYDTSDTGNAAADWNTATTCFRCLGWQVSFAQAHGKALSLPEWGVGHANNSLDDAHGAYFVTQTAAWMKTNGYLYFDYWNTNESYCGVISGEPNGSCPGGYAPPTSRAPYQLPQSAAAFLAAF